MKRSINIVGGSEKALDDATLQSLRTDRRERQKSVPPASERDRSRRNIERCQGWAAKEGSMEGFVPTRGM